MECCGWESGARGQDSDDKRVNDMQRVLCTYVTRRIDSNLLMAGTVFQGLKDAGYHTDMIFCGTKDVCEIFSKRYGGLFNSVKYLEITPSCLGAWIRKDRRLALLSNFWTEYVKDAVCRPYSIRDVRNLVNGEYDVVLSFVPIFASARLGFDVVKKCLKGVRLVQFWTDPLALGGCKDAKSIPKRRILHLLEERRALAYADDVVFCYPLLMELETAAHPKYARKMRWSDVGYIKHERDDFVPRNKNVTVGLFGAYQRKVRNIEPLLSVMASFPDVRFVIRGDSDFEIDAARYPNLDVKTGRIPVEEVEALEAQCDILISLSGRYTVMPPGKTFYYASYNKPLVFIVDGPRAEYMEQHFSRLCRYICCANEKSAIEAGLRDAVTALDGFKKVIPMRMHLDTIAHRIINGEN